MSDVAYFNNVHRLIILSRVMMLSIGVAENKVVIWYFKAN